MDIQEEIREGIITNITKACPEMLGGNIIKLTDKILQDEHSQGVVIQGQSLGGSHPHLANYYTVEPLIEGKDTK